MKSIAFIDTEVEPRSGRIHDIGGVNESGDSFHKNSVADFIRFIRESEFVCGHNILRHDIRFIGSALKNAGIDPEKIIDTLFLSPLLFPNKPYHALLKDEKIVSEESNNPLSDAIKARDLFFDEVSTFNQSEERFKRILYGLLKDKIEFRAFFRFLSFESPELDIEQSIRELYVDKICERAQLSDFISRSPIELAYCLSLLNVSDRHSITPRWVLRSYPLVETIISRLRNTPCLEGCSYCNQALDIHKALKRIFGFDSYRKYGGEPLQERAVQAAVNSKSILAVFPTGGGKSITFQVPALMSGENAKALTVVISPLQSLMKDQVDNLEKAGIVDSVTVNGLLDPIERAKSLERIEDGSANILYISPESLRSKTIERLLLGRKIARFVIDEAHCFSSWGQDFRVDYLYIGDFIKNLQEQKNLEEQIPVSCFTATAKQKVIEDIRDYFRTKLSIELEFFTSKASRTNLHYKVFEKEKEEDKYQLARDLIEEKGCPTIIYVSRTKKADELAERLTGDGFQARSYHGKMDKQEKSANQDAFISGDVQIMVATSAFGMGVDKKDVGMVIHFEISDSLENYVQEAGRAGRDETIEADCFVLFNEDDLSKHFILLNQSKLSIKEIQQVWKAIKDLTRFRSKVSNSALEIARMAGWEDGVADIESRVKTAIAALEDAGYLRRGQNMPRVFADSILSKNAQEAIYKIDASRRFDANEKMQAARIIKKLFSSKNRKSLSDEAAESRIDYISDHLGIGKEEVIKIVGLLREEKILADNKDLSAFIKRGETKNRSRSIADSYKKIEMFLLSILRERHEVLHLKELNERAEKEGCTDVSPNRIKTILNFWAIRNWISRRNLEGSKNHFAIQCKGPLEWMEDRFRKRHELAGFIVDHLYAKTVAENSISGSSQEEIPVQFSVLELKEAFERQSGLFKVDVSIDDVEDSLFYLSRIEALKIEGGFMVVYNRLTIERLEQDNRKKYKLEDYQKLDQFYESKVQQIHIVGEYAKKMVTDYKEALQFVDDYFQLNYGSFLSKYFKGRQGEISRNITPAKFRQLFGELSPAQLSIIKDSAPYIVVAAGPGSGKTKVLVHKLASLVLLEDVKYEQLLMLTFSRAAATEFKMRLQKLIGNAASFIEIKTFHSYCFDLLGKVGSIEKSDAILRTATERIRRGEVEASKITKNVLVIDEAQDMNQDEYALVSSLMDHNEDMRVIAVGDDDQNIYEFRGADSKYLREFLLANNAVKHELVVNYRSKANLVHYTNQFVSSISNRLKNTPIISNYSTYGSLRVFRYQCTSLIVPLVRRIANTDLAGTTCILSQTNEEAFQIAGLISRFGLHAKLIQSNDGFNLCDLAEIRFFLACLSLCEEVFIFSDEDWDQAKRSLVEQFRRSALLETCLDLLSNFEALNPGRKYKSDLEAFIRESRLEDFIRKSNQTIFVSTIHKSKGREFDNVFIMLKNFHAESDEKKRLLYVGMTRAKNSLTIHINTPKLDDIVSENLERINDSQQYGDPDELALHLTHKDVWLNYFFNRQDWLVALVSGDSLVLTHDGCLNQNGMQVLKFSREFKERIQSMSSKNFVLKEAKVNFVVHWHNEEGREAKIILPQVVFQRRTR